MIKHFKLIKKVNILIKNIKILNQVLQVNKKDKIKKNYNIPGPGTYI